jgi:phage-related protein
MAAKKITVIFFTTESGTAPVREWLKSLGKADRVAIGEDIADVEFEWPVGLPVCRPLGSGLYEMRTTLKDRIARVFFTIEGSDMILLHGFIKKSQSTPKPELDLARRRQQSYRRRI